MIVVGCLAVAAAIAYIRLYFFVKTFVQPPKRSDEELIKYEKEVKKFSDEWLDEKYVPVESVSRFGYKLQGYYYDFGNEGTVVCLHGHNSSHISQMKYMELFKKLGFNVFLVDHRRSGNSGGKCVTFGAKEKYDVLTALENLKKLYPDLKISGLFGESMGAATAMLVAPQIPGLGFLIEYCGYANFEGLLIKYIKNIRLRKLAVFLISTVTKPFFGFLPKECDAAAALKNTDCPMLIMHSLTDEVVVYENSEILNRVRPDALKVVFENSCHARSLIMYPERFEGAVREIIERSESVAEKADAGE